MPYVQRNAEGMVVGLMREEGESAQEYLAPAHPEVMAFLSEAVPGQESQFSPRTDLEMVRVIEDLVDLLIAKNVIVLTDLPEAVQRKLLSQRNRRSRLFDGMGLDEGEKGLF